MRKLILEQKTGFLSSLPFQIYDKTGILFYSSDFTEHISKGEKLMFNLPLGEYTYNGTFIKLDNPVKVVSVVLPPKERNISHKRYEIVFGDNENKCTIFYDEGVILFDNSFKAKPLYIKYTLYFHELGHHWYKTESKADLYAAKKLLDLGFNPSQIGLAVMQSLTLDNNLSEEQILEHPSFIRKMKIVYELTKNNS